MSSALLVHGQLAAHDTCGVVSVNLPRIRSFYGCHVYTSEHERHTMCMLCDRLNQGQQSEAVMYVQAIMTEPVIAADGHTYEKAAVHEWLLHHTTSPVTGDFLAHTRLVPNFLIKTVLARHQQHL